jgi:hypothetical protein
MHNYIYYLKGLQNLYLFYISTYGIPLIITEPEILQYT